IGAALMHDFVNVPKTSPDRAKASEMSAEAARPLLKQADFDESAIERISVAVRQHSFSRGEVPVEPLAMALQDADRLETLGAIGILRTTATGDRMGATFFHGSDPWAEDRVRNDLKWTLDHYFTKLLTLPKSLRTEAGQAEAKRRTEFMVQFLTQLGEEMGVPLPEGLIEKTLR
ncbi:MAG: HD domain-containing protein, partial [Myxococcales bacterium]|nr:HD domain-containing protein [Myxococcales bacterium]